MHIERHIEIKSSIPLVFKYVADFSNIFEWDSSVVEASRQELSPIQKGSSFFLKYAIAGLTHDVEYKIIEFEENKKVCLQGQAEIFTATDVIEFSPSESGTNVRYVADIELKSKWQDKAFQPVMEKIADNVVLKLKKALESEPYAEKPQVKNLNPLSIPFRFTTPGWKRAKQSFLATPFSPKHILITGATSGLGRSAAFTFAGKNCDLTLIGRSEQKLLQLEQELKQQGYAQKPRIYLCDLQNASETKQVAQKICQESTKIDVLINNAGALFSEPKEINGTERTTIINLVAPWILCHELYPVLKESKGCIINVVSAGMYGAALDLEKLIQPEQNFSGARAYANAKRGTAAFSEYLNHQWQPSGVRIHSMHPGWAHTPGVETSLPTFYKWTRRFLRTPFAGADTMVWLAMTNPSTGGQLWFDRRIQPMHISNSTLKKQPPIKELITLLDTIG